MTSSSANRIDLRHEQFLGTKFFPSLDGLRAFSILAVIFHHAMPHSSWWMSQGESGVQLFFVISGFLITTLLLRERDSLGQISLPRFYLRRGLRIFPLYYATLILYAALVFLLQRHTPEGRAFFSNLPSFATYTSNWFVDPDSGQRVIFYFAWSLAVEEQFYLVWPSILRFTKGWIGPVTLILIALAAWQIVRLLHWPDPAPLYARIAAGLAPAIFLGALLAILLHSSTTFRLASPLLSHPLSVPITLLLMLLSIHFTGGKSLLTAAAMTTFLASIVTPPATLLSPLLQQPTLRYIGAISYGMYMLHMLGMQFARKIASPLGPVAVFLTAILLAVVLASISYWSFEIHFLKLKDRWGKPHPKKTPEPVAEPQTVVQAGGAL